MAKVVLAATVQPPAPKFEAFLTEIQKHFEPRHTVEHLALRTSPEEDKVKAYLESANPLIESARAVIFVLDHAIPISLIILTHALGTCGHIFILAHKEHFNLTLLRGMAGYRWVGPRPGFRECHTYSGIVSNDELQARKLEASTSNCLKEFLVRV